MRSERFLIYRIYDENGVFYVGRTTQTLKARMRQHMTITKETGELPHIDPSVVRRIEFAKCESEADMCLYEVYYINLLKPYMNADAKAQDRLTVTLPELKWHPYLFCTELQEWERIYRSSQMEQELRRQKSAQLDALITDYEQKLSKGLITEEEFFALVNQSSQIYASQIGGK